MLPKLITKKDIRLNLPRKQRKWENGSVLAVGGSSQYVGAVALAGIAALRTGCDIVTVVAPEKVAWAVNALYADLITVKMKGNNFASRHTPDIVKIIKKYDVLLIGNGIGASRDSKKFIVKLFHNKNIMAKYKVIDADALKMVDMRKVEHAVFTPHIMEFEFMLQNAGIGNKSIHPLLSEKNVNKKARYIYRLFNDSKNKGSIDLKDNIILLKGPADIIISKNKILLNKTGNAGMTKGGTGDVLAGLCAGFLAQGRDLLQSAVNATYLNGIMGDMLLKKHKGYSFIASDMAEEIKKFT